MHQYAGCSSATSNASGWRTTTPVAAAAPGTKSGRYRSNNAGVEYRFGSIVATIVAVHNKRSILRKDVDHDDGNGDGSGVGGKTEYGLYVHDIPIDGDEKARHLLPGIIVLVPAEPQTPNCLLKPIISPEN